MKQGKDDGSAAVDCAMKKPYDDGPSAGGVMSGGDRQSACRLAVILATDAESD